MSDYISREAFKKKYLCCGYLPEMSEKEFDEFPAADVEPVRHGLWKQCFEDWRQQIDGNECFVCGFKYFGTGIRSFHYCPNCGAKMDLEDENHDN